MDVSKFLAFRWSEGALENIEHPDLVKRENLIAIDKQISTIIKNTRAFVNGNHFLNMLLWGERGSGKSSVVKMLLETFKDKGLRVIEIDKESAFSIYPLYKKIRCLPEYRFLLFFDDISFDAQDDTYRRFKSIIEGGIEQTPKNVMFVATSNKRHLIKEHALNTQDIYSRDEINEQLSLFGRFGLIVGFPPFSKEEYLSIVKYYLERMGIEMNKEIEKEAEAYAMERASRSGRVAKQFAIYKSIFR